jgi:hypothetical protein
MYIDRDRWGVVGGRCGGLLFRLNYPEPCFCGLFSQFGMVLGFCFFLLHS